MATTAPPTNAHSGIKSTSGGRGRGGRGRLMNESDRSSEINTAVSSAPSTEAANANNSEPSHPKDNQPSSSSSSSSSHPSRNFSARGGRGGRSALTSSSLKAHDVSTAPPSSTLTRAESTASDASEVSTASSMTPHPECIICSHPIASYTITTCQHSAHICGNCTIRMKCEKPKAKKAVEQVAAASASVGNDLLNDANDFKPTPAQLEAQAAKANSCKFCFQDWSVTLITREYDIHSQDPKYYPPPTANFGLSTDAKYNLSKWIYFPKWNVYFENETVKNKFFMMSSLYCPVCHNLEDAFSKGGNPNKKYSHVHFFLDRPQLEAHMKEKHHRYLCEACMTTREVFIEDQEVFTEKELTAHFQYGSNINMKTEYRPDGYTNGVIEPHPFCPFCSKPYFSQDELYAHLINQHRSCRFCHSEGYLKYFRSDAALRTHFGKSHYLCDEGKCKKVEANHAAFRDVLALKAHKLAAHSEGLSKEEIKRMQTVDLDTFRRDTSYQRPGAGASSSSGRRGKHDQIEEFEFKVDEPALPGHVEDFHAQVRQVEDFPSLGSSSVGVDNRSRYANDGTLMAQSGRDREREQKLYQQIQAVAQRADTNVRSSPPPSLAFRSEEAFPSLGGSSSSATGSVGVGMDSFRRVAPPSRDEFPTLKSVVKAEAKFTKKQEEKKAQEKAAKKANKKEEVAPELNTVDNRLVSAVPLPLPSPVPASELPARNKALVSGVKAALQNDSDAFEQFKNISSKFCTESIQASDYLDEFEKLMKDNPAGARETERLLMDLIATLPEEAHALALHKEYARRKVWQNVEKMKKNMKTGGIVGVESNSSNSKTTDAPTKRPTPSPSPPLPSKSPAIVAAAEPSPKAAVTAASAVPASSPSPAPAKSPDEFSTVESKADRKASKDAAKKAAAAQGIGEFQGRAAKPLKKDDDGDFLSIVAKEKEEQAEKERQREREKEMEKEKELQAQNKKKGWTESSSAGIVAPVARAPPGFSSGGPSNLARQNSWNALNGDGDEPSQISEPVGQASAHKPNRTAAKSTLSVPSSHDSKDDDEEEMPSLQSLALRTASPGVQLPEPEVLDSHLSLIESLKIPQAAKGKLQFLTMVLHELHNVIFARHGAINAPTNRRFQLSTESRNILNTLLRQTRFNQITEFSRLTRLGLMPNSVQVLSGVVGMYHRYGADMISDNLNTALMSMSSQEIFMLVEYTHAVLLQVTKSTHPDMKELLANYEKDEARRVAQNEQFKAAVPLKKDSPSSGDVLRWQNTTEDLFEQRRKKESEQADDGSSGSGAGKKQKKGKQLLFKFG